jgi:hypothetical protein
LLACWCAAALGVVGACGSVAVHPNDGAGGNGVNSHGGTGGPDSGGGRPGDAGNDGGQGGGSSPSIRYRGGIEAVGPIASTSATIRIVNAGLTYPRTRVCGGVVCLSGGIVP